MLATWKSKLLALLGTVASLALVYFIGRRNRRGEVDVGIAQRELELTRAKHEKMQAKLDALHDKQTSIVADILEEEMARLGASNKELTDEQIVARLRLDGLIQ